MGFYFPDVAKSQSPANLVVACAWIGPEKLSIIREATKELFSFAARLNGKFIEVDCQRVSVNFFFVGDLKMEPMVFGIQSATSNRFCTRCEVTRAEHKKGRGVYRQRDIDTIVATANKVQKLKGSKQFIQNRIKKYYKSISHVPLLRLPIIQSVPPPLHILQGLLNELLKAVLKTDKKPM
jgi:hypothetical protein